MLVEEGISSLARIFSKRSASPDDVDIWGESLLHRASYLVSLSEEFASLLLLFNLWHLAPDTKMDISHLLHNINQHVTATFKFLGFCCLNLHDMILH